MRARLDSEYSDAYVIGLCRPAIPHLPAAADERLEFCLRVDELVPGVGQSLRIYEPARNITFLSIKRGVPD